MVSLCWGVCFMLCSWGGVLSLLVCLSVLGCLLLNGFMLCLLCWGVCFSSVLGLSCLSWFVSCEVLCWGVMFYALLLGWCPVSLGLSLCVGVYVLCSAPGVVSCLSCPVSLGLSLCVGVYVLCSAPGVVSCLSWFVSLCWGVCFMLCSWGGVLSLLVCLSVLGCMFYALLLGWCPVSLGLSLCVGVYVLCSAPGVVSCLSWFVSLCWGVCFMLCSWGGVLSLLVCLSVLGCMFYALLLGWCPVSLGLSLCVGVYVLCSAPGVVSCLSWFVSLCWGVCFMLCSWSGVLSLLVCLSVLGCMFYALLLGWFPVSLGLSLCVGVYVLCSAPEVVSCLSWFVSLCWGVCFMLCSWGGVLSVSWFVSLCWGVCFMLCSWGGVLSLLVCLSVLGCMFYALLLGWCPVSLGLSLCVGVYVLCSAPGVVSCLSWFVSLCCSVQFYVWPILRPFGGKTRRSKYKSNRRN